MAEFDVSALMKDVSKVATGREQITYIPFDDIVPDEGNGYSMEGLDELARSIEIVGLQQPLRVRPIQGEPGRYRIVSGHRRRAAIGLVIKRGSKRFADGVPCIVDVSEASAALRELQLLLGNADNRKMTPADELQQAERISDCIRRLEDEGYTFPGRHREWVSKLSGLSRTKLGRLQAIKNNLVPELFHFFEIGQLNETAANELQKLPKEAQEAIAESCKRTGDAFFITSDAAAHCVKYAERYMAPCKCGNGDECDHHTRRFVQSLRAQYGWQRCSGECCLSCSELHQCKAVCAKGRDKQKEDKETKAAEEAKASEKRAREDAKRQAEYRQQLQREAQRVLPLIEAAGLDGRNTLRGRNSYVTVKVADVRKYAAGDFGDDHFYSGSFLPSDVAGLEEWAILLGCTLDFLIGRAEMPQFVPTAGTEKTTAKAASGQWPDWISVQDGLPPEYVDVLVLDDDDDITSDHRMSSGSWAYSVDETIAFWMPRPPLPGADRDLSKTAVPVTKPATWCTGEPEADGRYLCLVDINTRTLHEQRCDRRDGKWLAYGAPIHELFTVLAWWPLPAEDPLGYTIGREIEEDEDE